MHFVNVNHPKTTCGIVNLSTKNIKLLFSIGISYKCVNLYELFSDVCVFCFVFALFYFRFLMVEQLLFSSS